MWHAAKDQLSHERWPCSQCSRRSGTTQGRRHLCPPHHLNPPHPRPPHQRRPRLRWSPAFWLPPSTFPNCCRQSTRATRAQNGSWPKSFCPPSTWTNVDTPPGCSCQPVPSCKAAWSRRTTCWRCSATGFLCDSVIGAMTVAKLIHEKDKVAQGCVVVAQDSVMQQWLLPLAITTPEVVVEALRLEGAGWGGAVAACSNRRKDPHLLKQLDCRPHAGHHQRQWGDGCHKQWLHQAHRGSWMTFSAWYSSTTEIDFIS